MQRIQLLLYIQLLPRPIRYLYKKIKWCGKDQVRKEDNGIVLALGVTNQLRKVVSFGGAIQFSWSSYLKLENLSY